MRDTIAKRMHAEPPPLIAPTRPNVSRVRISLLRGCVPSYGQDHGANEHHGGGGDGGDGGGVPLPNLPRGCAAAQRRSPVTLRRPRRRAARPTRSAMRQLRVWPAATTGRCAPSLLYPAAGAGRSGDPVRTDAAPAAGQVPAGAVQPRAARLARALRPGRRELGRRRVRGGAARLPAHQRRARRTTARKDIKNQPADAAYVIRKVRDLGRKAGDPLQRPDRRRPGGGGRPLGRRLHHDRAVHRRATTRG